VDIRDTFKSAFGQLPLNYYALNYHKDQAMNYFPKQVKPMLQCFEKYFGPYPFANDGYALVETPYWGMEHQSAIAYGNHFQLNPYGFDFIIVHESGHEWWGNSLSCGDQAEMWLHESFTTYAEALYVECTQGYAKSVQYLNDQRTKIKNEEPMIGPMGVNYYERPDNDIYYKGTWMLHTLRHVINNDPLWFKILYSFQQDKKYSIITTYDFVKYVNAMTKKDYTSFFNEYLCHAAPPQLFWQVKQKGPNVEVTCSWIADEAAFNMPIDIMVGKKKTRIYPTTKSKVTVLKNAKATDIKLLTGDFYYTLKEVQ
jgi:aminopeptidase N